MRGIAVLGAGAWGTALAVTAARRGIETALWVRRPEALERLRREGENAAYLPGAPFPRGLRLTDSLGEAVERADAAVVAVPSHGFRPIAAELARVLRGEAVAVSATKGIEVDSLRRMSEVLREEFERAGHGAAPIAVLSGPSFAGEVALGHPTALVVASQDREAARRLQSVLSGGDLRLYTNADVAGVEIGGAFKNVIAIAAGVVEGLGLGSNTRAALITRGLAEISRLGTALGGRAATLAGLAGMGDLVLTCTGAASRNRAVGLRLGAGETLEAILASMTQVAEGVRTTRAVNRLAAREGVELPIARQMEGVLFEGTDPRRAIRDLMERELRDESDA